VNATRSGEMGMRIHHLNCGTISVWGGVAIIGTGGLLRPAWGVTRRVLAETDDGLGTHDLAAPSPVMRLFLAMSGIPRDPVETASAQVKRLGYDPEEVRHIAITHFHYDHVGGLPDFPRAQVHIYRDEYQGVTQPRDLYERNVYRPEHWAHGPRWVVHDLQGDAWFGMECTPLVDLGSAAFCFVPLPGHTRGHCGVALRTDDGWLLHCGDAYAYHGDVDPVNPRRPPYTRLFGPVIYANKAFRQIGRHAPRLRAPLRAHGDQVRLTCTHDPHDHLAFTPR
jgi:glyoxylase-like metal-dependent hydrolase (beta-lactamase superfamily II)